MMAQPSVEFARSEQLRCAEEIERDGWNEQQAALGLGDWFAEEFLMTHEKENYDAI